jgi:enamine deaminase RidA (YjgF/YER057c/UK114 family)
VDKELIQTSGFKAGYDDRIFSPALRVGPWLFLSGIVAFDNDRKQTVGISGGSPTRAGKVDPEAQWRQTLTNMKQLLEAAGGSMRDVVMANVFVTDIRYYLDYEYVRAEFFEPPYPVCTAVAVHALVHPDWVIEIEATAYLGER